MKRATFLAAGAALGVVALAAFASRAQAAGADVNGAEKPQPLADDLSGLNALYATYGAMFGVDWRLVHAVALHESGENPAAVNHADNESLGLMQVLCRPDGRGGCANKLNVQGWSTATRERLLDPDFNVYIGAQILADNIRQYGVEKGIAVYNAWDQHTAPTAGPFKNQAYVDDVLRRASDLGWSR